MLSAFARDKVLHKTKGGGYGMGKKKNWCMGGSSYLLFELQEYLMARSSVGACLELKLYRLLSTSAPIFKLPLALLCALHRRRPLLCRFTTESEYYFVGLRLIFTPLYFHTISTSFIFHLF